MLIDGYEIDMDHEDAYAEGMPNALYIEGEKRKIDAGKGLSTYIGTKIIQAEPQTCQKDSHNSKVGDPGYKVLYEDSYISWSPKDVFEGAYRKTDGMTFGLAVEAMKMGKKVRHIFWNDHMYVFMRDNRDYKGFNPCWCIYRQSDEEWDPNQHDILEGHWQIWEEK